MPVTSKLHDIFIKREKQGMTYSSIAREYGVSRQYIFSAMKRLHALDYQKKLDAVNPEKMNELILPVRVVTFLKKKKLYMYLLHTFYVPFKSQTLKAVPT
tara:strand:+ start:15 stop:314 length:300 start_codon:yes stop_codon:yes gene_type:complete